MICSLKSSISVLGLNENMVSSKAKPKGVLGICSSGSFSRPGKATSRACSVSGDCSSKTSSNVSIHAQSAVCVSRALRWWEKTLTPNDMIEIHSAQQLVHSLLNAGDALVVVDFYSPDRGGCKALHPKICQIAGLYPNVIFLKVNFEEYAASDCTEEQRAVFVASAIKKFKDALSKHGNERSSLGPARCLDESELKTLASVGEISADYQVFCPKLDKMEDMAIRARQVIAGNICWRLYADDGLNF